MIAEKYSAAFIVFGFAWATDCLDGYIARKYNMITNLGKILDPLVDKTLRITGILMLLIKGIFPTIQILIWASLFREFFLGIGDIILWKYNIHVASRNYSKILTGLFYFSAALAIILITYNKTVSDFLIFSSYFFMFVSFGVYISSFFRKKD
jgi:phosphatidylglycerophosphate synthase